MRKLKFEETKQLPPSHGKLSGGGGTQTQVVQLGTLSSSRGGPAPPLFPAPCPCPPFEALYCWSSHPDSHPCSTQDCSANTGTSALLLPGLFTPATYFSVRGEVVLAAHLEKRVVITSRWACDSKFNIPFGTENFHFPPSTPWHLCNYKACHRSSFVSAPLGMKVVPAPSSTSLWKNFAEFIWTGSKIVLQQYNQIEPWQVKYNYGLVTLKKKK